MENAEALMSGLFNAALVTMIVASMFAAGLSTTTMLLSVQVFVAVFVASYLGKKQPASEGASVATTQAS